MISNSGGSFDETGVFTRKQRLSKVEPTVTAQPLIEATPFALKEELAWNQY
ncbi:hypothetical protein [Thalassoglobus neptunius]|uniref:hypothetical protein n=1 Tax=Thalassoglobus neptunius TaxID=1938619 RepID=UPI0018D1F864|nr:hypothetical protein [Thalassoglobus neptunius]